MPVSIRSDILQLIIVTACCLSIAWLVRSPKQLAEVLYARKSQSFDKTGNQSAKPGGNMGKAEALQEINAAITANKVMVYSKTYCPYCVKAKNALNQFIKPNQYTVVELDERPDTDVMQDALLEVTGGRSVPRVFINGKFLGGGDDTAAAAANGTLQKLLTEAGVL
ncbi:hypothetical protein VOLCADRAFT_107222 [Volvox carteri f. nagariensis]|uniref:Glutaredoxin domain-containing protein n=1 Tax=Volvox carteri f. nagariensis TaxID=3068 RepID=D8UCP8_VOLCA|nr:uncharacterized protein VOLCADRAFT_107222 [Volvox carteri f. nagariensis]EFJ42530.1 hypothetical protein VOLCADRAFT_107222 [Volvox carteri f. nagariensis]|eukprot:XP_002956386.1 hypothetical protein VOLCADRAFT_107222 [Volvox carteri f. nagariensis]